MEASFIGVSGKRENKWLVKRQNKESMVRYFDRFALMPLYKDRNPEPFASLQLNVVLN
jgi:hypothetical protein